MKFNIATLPGDGVGPEVINEGIKVLKAAEEIVTGFSLEFEKYDAGNGHYLKTGVTLPESVFQACKDSNAIFMGSIGLPKDGMPVVVDENGTEVTGHVMFKLRFDLNLFAGVRPIKLYPGVVSPLANVKDIDFVVLRENCEGLFASYGAGIILYDDIATDTQIITRKGTEKIVDFGFQLALKRNGRLSDGKKAVTCADKHNVFRSFAFFRKVYNEVAERYEGQVEKDYAIIDALTLWMVQTPQNFDVIVTENMFGDIISDLAGAFVGGMGMSPSGDVGHNYGMFQPSHGTAPTIAGKGIANPVATILSGKMMLDWLGDRHDNKAALTAAELVEKAVSNTLARGIKTVDIGGTAGTSQFGDAVIAEMRRL
ncbi:MAG: 3-isopropylmalate dehydrogenase [Peptococcaceae bacterium BICA1-8]|nr:MAG: 3-isopropylmalate dehydrogenase [Peptococcaceae bacterium BICA1-8]